MRQTSKLIDLPAEQGDGDNITDWCLVQFREHYQDNNISKDDIWEYLYGVMHAPDWRERYQDDLRRNLPRVPFAPDFQAFRQAGRELMDLHSNYETVPEWPVACLVDDQPDEGASDSEAYRIQKSMRWGRDETAKQPDRSILIINERCRLVGIPPEVHEYTVSGRSPVEWAMASLRWKHDKKSGVTDDPNQWHLWAEEPFNLIRHLRRLVYVAATTVRIVRGLPPSLSESPDHKTGPS